MVGDTLTDMKFASNSGVKAVGVAKKDADKKMLSPFADYIFNDISYVLEALK